MDHTVLFYLLVNFKILWLYARDFTQRQISEQHSQIKILVNIQIGIFPVFKIVKYYHLWAHQYIGTTLKLWAHYITEGKTVWLLDSDYITAMQEPDFR